MPLLTLVLVSTTGSQRPPLGSPDRPSLAASAVITGPTDGSVRLWPAAASRRPQPTTSRQPVFGRRVWEADTKLMQTIEDVPQCVAGVHALPTAVGSQLVASRDLAVAGQSTDSCALGGKGGWLW